MNACIIGEINKKVKPSDTLWIVGDLGFGSRDDNEYFSAMAKLRGQIRCTTVNLVKGNHDRTCVARLFNNCRNGIPNVVFDARLDGHRFTLNHWVQFSWPGSGNPNFPAYHGYGHHHGTMEKVLDKLMPTRRSLDVGADNAFRLFGEYRPFSVEEFVEIVQSRFTTASGGV